MWYLFKHFINNLLLWCTQTLNVWLSIPFNLYFKPTHLFGSADESLSSVFGKNKGHNPRLERGRRFINALFFWQEDHCQWSIEWDEGQKRLVD